jgi:hypothetical protein
MTFETHPRTEPAPHSRQPEVGPASGRHGPGAPTPPNENPHARRSPYGRLGGMDEVCLLWPSGDSTRPGPAHGSS